MSQSLRDFPDRIDRRRQRMDEGVHVGGVEVVLLVPGRRRQHDVGIHAGRRHAEIERDQQVELSFRRLVVPDDFRSASSCRPRRDPCPCTPCLVPSRCLRKYSWPLPDAPSRLERQTNRLRGQFFGLSGSSQENLQFARLQATWRHSPSASRPAAAACFDTSSGLVSSCGADGSQPMRSARTL